MGENEKKESFFSKIKKVKHIEIIIAVFAVAVMLVIYFAGFGGGGSKNSASDGTSTEKPEYYSDYCLRMQKELASLISAMDGAGKTQVLISWESSVELILAQNQNNSANSSSNSPIIINSSGLSQPIVTKEIYPKALGVMVVCEGGGDARVKVGVIISVSTLLNIASEKVLVYAMSKK